MASRSFYVGAYLEVKNKEVEVTHTTKVANQQIVNISINHYLILCFAINAGKHYKKKNI
jgi:hypothetical protein